MQSLFLQQYSQLIRANIIYDVLGRYHLIFLRVVYYLDLINGFGNMSLQDAKILASVSASCENFLSI